MIVLSGPMLMNVNNTSSKCPNKTDVLTVFLLGAWSDIKHVTRRLWGWVAERSLIFTLQPPKQQSHSGLLKVSLQGSMKWLWLRWGFAAALCAGISPAPESRATVPWPYKDGVLSVPERSALQLVQRQWQTHHFWWLRECSFPLGECHKAGIWGISALPSGLTADWRGRSCQSQLWRATFCIVGEGAGIFWKGYTGGKEGGGFWGVVFDIKQKSIQEWYNLVIFK